MSMTSNRYNSIEDAKKAYRKAKAAAYQQEYDTMAEVLAILRDSNKPMTARQIAHECDRDISTAEVAANLIAINDGLSRFGSSPVSDVRSLDPILPQPRKMKIRNSGVRRVKVVELNEDGQPTNRVHTLFLKSANTYQL